MKFCSALSGADTNAQVNRSLPGRRVKKVANDMVFDHNMNPAYIHTPDRVKNWLKRQIEQGYLGPGYQVRIGATMKFVSVSDYLDGEAENQEGNR